MHTMLDITALGRRARRLLTLTLVAAGLAGVPASPALAWGCGTPPMGLYYVGTNGDDTIGGTGLRDWIDGAWGDDTIAGRDGNDDLYGGEGNDRLLGEGGSDYLWGESGSDQLFGGAGDDKIQSHDGPRDYINCGTGYDEARVTSNDLFVRPDFDPRYISRRSFISAAEAGCEIVYIYVAS